MNALWASIIVGIVIGTVACTQHFHNRAKALRRIERIKHLLSLTRGNEKAIELHEEAMSYCYYYGFAPDDFGLAYFEDLRDIAAASLQRYIETEEELYEDELKDCMSIQQSASQAPDGTEAALDRSKHSIAVQQLSALINSARMKLTEFNNPKQWVDLTV